MRPSHQGSAGGVPRVRGCQDVYKPERPTGPRRAAPAGLVLAALALPALAWAAAPVSKAPLRLVPAGPAEVSAIGRAPGASATLLNVWATWCVPCRQEFPDLVRLGRAYRDQGLRLALVSADFDGAAARTFLRRQGVTGPAWLKTGGDQAFIDALDRRWTGSLPATFVYDRHGRLVEFWEGRADYSRMETAVRRALAAGAQAPSKETP